MTRDPSDGDQISKWIEQIKNGDEQSIRQLWTYYNARLERLARSRTRNGPANFVDADDIVQSAFASFYFRVKEGQYPDLSDRDDLWKLLIAITLSKIRAIHRKEGRRHEILEREFARLESPQEVPNPEVALEMAEQFDLLIDQLGDELLQRVALAKLEGCTNREISTRVAKSVPTIERKLRLIRRIWSTPADD